MKQRYIWSFSSYNVFNNYIKKLCVSVSINRVIIEVFYQDNFREI